MFSIVVTPIFIVFAALLTATLVIFGVRLQLALRRFKIKKLYTAALEAPSVSVCIPARNETHAMTQCLERVLASDYEKLEIVVYDDHSKDDTSILIKSFAHAGVRFVPGTALPDSWLGRNHALDVLAHEASGTYLIFLSVDTVIQPNTISQLVGYMMTEKLAMASVIPGKNDVWRANVLFGHLRYFWELILSRPSAPAAATALWTIERHALLDQLGGFEPFKDTVQPESHMAASLGTTLYHCLLSNHQLGVTYEKRWLSQVETSKRLLYPMIGGTWQRALLGFIILILLNLPLLTILSSLLIGWTMIQTMALWLMCAYMALYGIHTAHTWQGRWWLGGLLWPVVIFQELILFTRSVWGYARGTVTWKGRLVTAPPYRIEQIEVDQ
jgi:glycosyltransferase involved in cell wall biosynthesis